MTSENKKWDSLKAEYLRQVAKALSSVKHPRSKEVLEDVRSHLDRRFAELEPQQQTWENFQAIITEMGPASDYAKLLEPDAVPANRDIHWKYLLWVALVFTGIIAAMIILPVVLSDREKAYEPEESWSTENLGPPFVADPKIVGFWKSVDFVQRVEDFDPDVKTWKDELYLKDVRFMANGRTSASWTWTKDWIWHSNGKTKARYKIKEMAGGTYLFLPWLSGDVTIRGQKPRYYVLKKAPNKNTLIKKATDSTKEKAIEAAIDSAQIWLKLLDHGAYGQTWEQAAGYLKKAVSKDQLQRSFEAVRRPLGNVISRRIKSRTYTKQAPGAPDGEYVIIQFETSFENKQSAVETVTPMLDEDGTWRVSGYYIK